MPFYRRRYRKRNTRRPLYRRRKVYNKVSSKRPTGSGNDGKRFFKLREVQELVGVDPNVPINIVDDPTGYGDFVSIRNLFDKFRVNAISVKFIPTVTAVGAPNTVWTPGFILHDENHTSVTSTNPNDFLQFENCKAVNCQRPWKYYRKMKRNVPMEAAGHIIDTSGYQATNQPTPTQVLSFLPPTLMPIDAAYGTLITSLYITAKARQ